MTMAVNFGDRRLPDSFWDRVSPCPMTGCWLWIGKTTHEGYGVARSGGRDARVHRTSFEAMSGLISDGLVIDHLCRVRCCVNPAHLEAVTDAVNINRGTSLSARRAKLTHCHRGHEFSQDNTRIDTRGSRRCLICLNEERKNKRAERLLAIQSGRCGTCRIASPVDGLNTCAPCLSAMRIAGDKYKRRLRHQRDACAPCLAEVAKEARGAA